MPLSEDGLSLLKDLEGFRSKIYLDSAGLPTIGYGHLLTMAQRKRGAFEDGISQADAETLLRTDVGFAERSVTRLVKVPLLQNQFDALVLFTFNVGDGAEGFGGSTLRGKLNAGDYASVPAEMARWNKARNPRTGKLEPVPGLITRRAREAQLWLGGQS